MCGYQHPGSKKVFKEEKTVTNVSRSKREGYLRTVKGGMEQRSKKWGPKEKKFFLKKKLQFFRGKFGERHDNRNVFGIGLLVQFSSQSLLLRGRDPMDKL